MSLSFFIKYIPICEKVFDKTMEYVRHDREIEAMKDYISRQKKMQIQDEILEGKKELENLGRKTWKKIHATVDNLPDDANPEQVRDAVSQVHQIIDGYPCRECRDHGLEFEKKIGLQDSTTKKDAVIKTCSLHNEVNDRLGKDKKDCNQYYDNLEEN
jgi:hypothetical protein